jgi:phasin
MPTEPPYDIPPEMRDFAEKSVDQARKAFDGFMDAAYRASGALDRNSDTAQASALELGRKAMGYAEQNVASALDFAGRLVNARDPAEIMALQAEFLRLQIARFGEQAKDLGETVSGASHKPSTSEPPGSQKGRR